MKNMSGFKDINKKYYKNQEVRIISTYEVNGILWAVIEDNKNKIQIIKKKDLKEVI